MLIEPKFDSAWSDGKIGPSVLAANTVGSTNRLSRVKTTNCSYSVSC